MCASCILGNLAVLCHVLVQMSYSTYQCLDVYKDTVDSTCDAVDSGIKVHVCNNRQQILLTLYNVMGFVLSVS